MKGVVVRRGGGSRRSGRREGGRPVGLEMSHEELGCNVSWPSVSGARIGSSDLERRVEVINMPFCPGGTDGLLKNWKLFLDASF